MDNASSFLDGALGATISTLGAGAGAGVGAGGAGGAGAGLGCGADSGVTGVVFGSIVIFILP